MKSQEAIEILETMQEMYPGKFEVTQRMVSMALPQLMQMDYKAVMDKLSRYAFTSPFPPSFSNIAVYLPQENDYLEKMKVWEQEAAEVSEETKRRFEEKLEQLMRRFSDDL
ncbi:MAG: hypothetical protein WAM07_18260 [Halobacillus sp.]|uniref:hypothetical protein n=1 Tax=Halobacillus sp. TaxID=56800 RepID=UPI003BB15300